MDERRFDEVLQRIRREAEALEPSPEKDSILQLMEDLAKLPDGGEDGEDN